jgi:hypothetical protein
MAAHRPEIVFLVIGLLVAATSATARTWRVERDGSGDYGVIQDAVYAASSGDTIRIGPGRYAEYTVFSWGKVYVELDGTKSLTFIGSGAEETIIGPDVYASGYTDYGFSCDNGNVTIRLENLRIENQNYRGVATLNSVVELVGCVIDRCYYGIHCIRDIQYVLVDSCQFINGPNQSSSIAMSCETPRALVRGTLFEHYKLCINFDYTGSTDVLVTNCRFVGADNGLVGMHFSMGAGGTVNNCYFTGWEFDGFNVLDAGVVTFHDNIIENCVGAGVGFQGCQSFTMYNNVIDQCVPCIFLGEPCGQQSVYNNRFIRNETVAGRYVRTPGYYPGGPWYLDFTNNDWGSTDPAYISQWIYDGYDDDDVGMFVVFEPMWDYMTGVGDGVVVPASPSLSTYPNPFNPQTTVQYVVSQAGPVSVKAFDVRGRLVRSLLTSTQQAAGPHDLTWDGRDDAGVALPSGTYVLRLEAGSAVRSLRVALIR